MGDVFSAIFGIIWVVVIVTIISKIASGASKAAKNQQQVRQNLQQGMITPQTPAGRAGGQQTFRSVPGSTYGSSNAARQTAYSAAKSDPYRARTAVDVKTHSVLLEDRKNDWLAQQLREEASLKHRIAGFDLGAYHEVECAADDLKKTHIRRHNTTGLNKKTFR